ncbi:hypothetical protein A2781_07195 [Candidatus Gottesmanbacteria bacterium RIFCSPHIGHO2_01_FULL_42_27]|uniref:LytR/CpsA/Psr regulator C-terminal domain-containing protein n=2 Tax=Candidatus Gottesmaniibacteriota TaxID=1752720 RepID=A0A1F6BAC0_9BACT|nr:MAG: hypothetical protein A2781_07195 [Candidatus Gottesmanbacteria bacterium RIFCSPHIGHO2_01_FULL_42_27]OGG20482.1 MAG: hypothetical protein A3E72_02185 [Candidatus Gottesmanbacteria bacterium RIFCSPHIGHO2_12_FULL_43_26]OGG33484.1 MAG: hypothetical protein A3G68_03885 [Candidatus Gottesmanbacteria bacterium RIFCSPLOWO2_12_FULL_42_10]OGG33911.1 MAG: hypothetical protein A2968_07515 [Candidatus Gottesmanbacteria bacterium RIFCSPLOWO2_01_FULL_42_22]
MKWWQNRNWKIFLIFILLLIAASIPSLYFYGKLRNLRNLMADPQALRNDEVRKTIDAVGKLMVLPETETPTVATVSDEEKLRQQPFFANAKKGDRVLIYPTAKKAILYDPVLNKIIEVSPINLASGSATTTPTESIKIYKTILLNGTQTVGLTKTYEESLQAKTANLEIIDRDNAAKKDYQKSLLVDLKGNSPQTQKLADLLKLTVSKLPEGESASPSADFLIILGSDRQ